MALRAGHRDPIMGAFSVRDLLTPSGGLGTPAWGKGLGRNVLRGFPVRGTANSELERDQGNPTV